MYLFLVKLSQILHLYSTLNRNLKMAVYKTCHEWKGIKILAYTVPENIASNKSLEKAGFSEKSSNKKEKCFVYKCS